MPENEAETVIYKFRTEARYLQSDLQTLTQGVMKGNIPIADAKKTAGKIQDRAERLKGLVNKLEGISRKEGERTEGK